MWLIDRDTSGEGPTRIPLPVPLREALVRWYVGDGDHLDEQAGIKLVQNARVGHKWLACDCLGRSVAPPILTPAYLSEAETYYLRRLTGTRRAEHRDDCPFFRDQATARISEVRSRHTPAKPPDGFFEVLKPAPEKLAQRPEDDSTDDRTRNAATPKLARQLWRLLDVAGVNHIAPLSARIEWSLGASLAAVTRASAGIELAPGIELSRAFWTHAAPLHAEHVHARLVALTSRWPVGHAPQGFLLLYARGFKGVQIDVANGAPVTLVNRIQSPSTLGNRVAGPWLVLVVVGEYPDGPGHMPLRGYAQPVLNGRLPVPVESEFERQTLHAILAAQVRLHHQGIDMAIVKPLFDILTRDGPCRPDFRIEARSRLTGEIRELAIEAMGFDTDAYNAVKAVTHPRMRHLGRLVTIRPEDVTSERAVQIILNALDM